MLSQWNFGDSILAYLNRILDTDFKWGRKDNHTRLAGYVQDAFQRRNEVTSGGVVTQGASIAAGTLSLNVTAIDAILNGRIMAQSAADSDVDYLVAAGTVGTPIYADGSTAAALSLATDETAYCSLIVCNSDGAGSVVSADNGAMKAVIIVAGTSSTYENQTAHLTSEEIQAALLASTNLHEGTTGWAHVAQILFDENSGSPQVTVVMNRNNVVSAA